MARSGGLLAFYARSAAGRAGVALRSLIGRDQKLAIGRYPATLPPAHRLPWFQSVFANYDRYAVPLLRTLFSGSHTPLLIDIGANVGDTALLALDAVDNLEVVAVEGDTRFLSYLRQNVRQVENRVRVIDRFVVLPDRVDLVYRSDGSTGGFVAEGSPSAQATGVSVAEVLGHAKDHDRVVWKSDTDGLDIPIVLSSWEQLDDVCAAIWFEFDPVRDVDGGAAIPDLAEAIHGSGRICLVFDNTGQHMLTVGPEAVREVLVGLGDWFRGNTVARAPEYADVWAIDPRFVTREASGRLVVTTPEH